MKNKLLCVVLVISLFTLTLSACGSGARESGRPEVKSEGETAESEQPAASSEALEASPDVIQVDTLDFYQDVFSDWRVNGVLSNNGQDPVSGVELKLTFLDSDSAEIQQTDLTLFPGGLGPGERASFSYTTSDLTGVVGQVEAAVTKAFIAEIEPVQLNLLGTALHESDNGTVLVTGEIENQSSEAAGLSQLSALLYSTDGDLAYAEDCQICPNSLAPGENGPFRMVMFGYPGELDLNAEPEMLLRSEVIDSLPAYDLSFQDDPLTYLDDLGVFHIVGELQNNSGVVLEIHTINTLYDLAGNVLDVSTYSVYPGSLASGESAPYDIGFGGSTVGLDIQPDAVTWQIQLDSFFTQVVDSPSLEISTEGDSFELSGSRSTFSGTIVNDSGQDLQALLILVGFREKDSGRLAAIERQLIWEPLPVGETREYSLQLVLDSQLDPGTLDHFLLVRGR